MARLWGTPPHLLLRASVEEMQINLLCLDAWDTHIERQIRAGKPMATIDIGGV